MPTPLSSRWTPFYKFILPALMLAGMGVGTWYAYAHPERQHLPQGFSAEYGWLFVVIIGLFVGGVMWWTAADLVRIELDDDELIISNYRTEIRVLLSTVEELSGPSTTNPQRYTITFKEATEFGRRVTFLPPMQWTLMLAGEAEGVVELRQALDAARDKASRELRLRSR